jgi:hypothetical protein
MIAIGRSSVPGGFIIYIDIGLEVRRIAGACCRGNVKGMAAGWMRGFGVELADGLGDRFPLTYGDRRGEFVDCLAIVSSRRPYFRVA